VRLVSPAEPRPARKPKGPPPQGSDAAGTYAGRLEIATPPSLEPPPSRPSPASPEFKVLVAFRRMVAVAGVLVA
jgi:hypothetical protein